MSCVPDFSVILGQTLVLMSALLNAIVVAALLNAIVAASCVSIDDHYSTLVCSIASHMI